MASTAKRTSLPVKLMSRDACVAELWCFRVLPATDASAHAHSPAPCTIVGGSSRECAVYFRLVYWRKEVILGFISLYQNQSNSVYLIEIRTWGLGQIHKQNFFSIKSSRNITEEISGAFTFRSEWMKIYESRFYEIFHYFNGELIMVQNLKLFLKKKSEMAALDLQKILTVIHKRSN